VTELYSGVGEFWSDAGGLLLSSEKMSKFAPHELPGWPRLLSRDLAAAYVGVSTPTFEACVKRGQWPQPLRFGVRVLYDRVAIDRVVDAYSNIGEQPDTGPTLADIDWEKF
jgi:hypothetical protein